MGAIYSTGTLNQQVDSIWGNKDNIISLIKQEKWKEAAQFGDHVSYRAVTNNEDWWWDGLGTLSNTENWNSCAYGNIAMGVHYGSQFPNRQDDIEKIKSFLQTI